MCKKHFNNEDKTYHISNKVMELGGVLLKMETFTNDDVKDIIDPAKFYGVVKSVTDLCEWDVDKKTVKTPSLGITI